MPTAHPGISRKRTGEGKKEFVMFWWLCIAVVSGISCFGAFAFAVDLIDWRRNRYYRNRVWCVWQVNHRVGLVPRDVFDRMSRKHWRLMRKNPIFDHLPVVHIHPPEQEVIVVQDHEFKLLEQDLHFFECREFFVPKTCTPFSKAYKRLNGRPWDPAYVNW